ncbi:MarR family winged helix-turn-helix transcriptional regulator [Kitasatospora sp. NBC_01539]|uniref:MarR family winged helix-turn-helix transcriptional regulator n=1 Tax=Kitasatospora sp. NBC_01539 TaxID=2903577 RepID=UPI0038602939
MYDGRKGSSSPFEQTVHLLAAASGAAEARLAERLAGRDTTRDHLSALEALARLGPHARPDLAARLPLGPTAAARVVGDLLSAGLAQSFFVQIGGRHEVMTITAAGQEALQRLHDDVSSVQDDLLSALTRGERSQLNALLRRVCATSARDPRPAPVPRQPSGRRTERERGRRTERSAEPDGGVAADGNPGEVAATEPDGAAVDGVRSGG